MRAAPNAAPRDGGPARGARPRIRDGAAGLPTVCARIGSSSSFRLSASASSRWLIQPRTTQPSPVDAQYSATFCAIAPAATAENVSRSGLGIDSSRDMRTT